MKNKAGIIIGGLIVVGVIALAASQNSGAELPAQNSVPVLSEAVSQSSPQTEQALNTSENVIIPEVVLASGMYADYSADKLAMTENGDVVIFFHASWCPSCRALDRNITENAGAIPGGVTILKADYDRENDLRQQYGVTNQHTLVQVDTEGNLIQKWSGGSQLDSVLSRLN